MTVQSPTKATLTLDSRQRAMLAEMGVSVWLPASNHHQATEATLAKHEPTAATPHQAAPPIQSQPQTLKPQPEAKIHHTPPKQPHVAEQTTPPSCQECAPYTNLRHPNDIALLPVNTTQPRWLFVLDSVSQDTPTMQPNQDKALQLLHNMAAALRLHKQQNHHCHACSCFRLALQHTDQAQPSRCSAWLLHEIMRIQPQVIVALGRQAAFSVLGSTAPLGSLRNTIHRIAIDTKPENNYPDWLPHIPVLVSYPLDYLLRTPAAKARAWQDLCLAHSTVHIAQ